MTNQRYFLLITTCGDACALRENIMNQTTIACLIGLAFTSTAFADTASLETAEVTVKANRFERKDIEASYATEIHSADDIAASSASNLYDYLAQQTSLNIISNFGNKATPSINLRGYGYENGSQNIVVTLDGQRLNNIDGAPQLLGAIPLANVERIEIIKGSGSVIYGDGATAGAVQIYTKQKTGVTLGTVFGNYGQRNTYLNAGINSTYLDLSASLAHDSNDGFSKKDETGHKDQFTSDSQHVKLTIKPSEIFRLFAEATSSRNDTRYVNALTEAEFKADPRQVTQKPFSQTYTHQALDSDQWQIGGEFDINPQLKLSATHFREDKTSAFVNFFNEFRYDYAANDINLRYEDEWFSTIFGYQDFDGVRKASDNDTDKTNDAYYFNLEHRANWLLDGLSLSAGIRKEKVRYQFKPDAGTHLSQTDHLDAWDIGANYQITPAFSVFTNYNRAYQTPDIDRFFTTDFVTNITSFNGFIKPAKVNTLNIGMHLVNAKNRLKMTAFYADLEDEIYLYQVPASFFFQNTNLDQSHKYGFEIQDNYSVNDQLSASLIYNYTRAIIDQENDGGSAYNGKNLPGVPRHSIVANLNYRFLGDFTLNLNHNWRASTYALNDFANNFSQKQSHYESTNIALNYQYQHWTFFTAINNLFDRKNAIQVADDAIYPVDFERTWRFGLKADF